MPIDCVVLDLDGTLTDVARESPPFVEAFPALIAELVGRDLDGAWEEAMRFVRAQAPELGWTMGGHAIAPADADPYVLASSAAQVVLDRFGVLVSDPAQRAEATTSLFHRAYQQTRAAFRPEAKQVLEALLARVPAVCLVTNAAADAAARKLATLAPAGLERLGIRGDARKFVIGAAAQEDGRFLTLPEAVQVSGLHRPVLLRRGAYFDALVSLWDAWGTGPERTLVCGDIYELDLAMPAALGAAVHLVRRARTFDYELDAMRRLGARGGVSDGLGALIDRVGAR